MRFLFVSQIHEIKDAKIRGKIEFSAQEPWRRTDSKNQIHISTSVVSEAVGQLVSWMSLRDNNFTGRPVFLFANRIDLGGKVTFASDKAPANIKVDLESWITDGNDESFVFSGTASVNGQEIVKITDCGGYFMPLAELEDPEVTRQRFAALTATGIGANPASPAFDFTSLVDSVIQLNESNSITTAKVMRLNEPFYPDHFPRFPVTPIVVINEMIGEATRRLVTQNNQLKIEVTPVAVQDLKIKSFIRPGDTATTSIKVVERYGNEIETIAEISVNQKRILRGRYRYRLENIQ